jgi:uncharacterized protein YbjT (DUF2867 family)
MAGHRVFITGATGHMGRWLIPELLRAGHQVRGLVRPGSEHRLPSGCNAVMGNALDAQTYAPKIAPCDTFVHLIGVSHPSPSKARQFRDIDLKSAEQAIPTAKAAGIGHFVYVSVAQPAPVMKAYIAARAEAEAILRDSGLNATILRPWYVLGPGHRWPLALVPVYWIMERISQTRESAQRLGLVTTDQMIGSLCAAVENPPRGVRIVTVPEIRKGSVAIAA